ncbi:MAG: LptF/LptG family permease [Gemmatimonadaceae bacterium]|nr:LptF/LptG family permease [Gemmatimonadaceae bacterium]
MGPLLFALSALTTLLLLNQVAKQFGALVGKGLSWGIIGEFFYLSVPFIVAMTLPMAVLVAVLYAFSRLAAENEVTALRASGVSVVRIVQPVMVGGAALALIMLLFNDQVLPRANHRLRTLQTDIARKKPTFALREQVINEVIPGKIFLKTGHIDPATNKLREVVIYNFEDPTHRKTIYADSGQMGLTADQSTLQMMLYSGYVLEVPRDDPQTLQRLYFTTDLVRVRGVANQFQKTEKDSYKSEREMTVCEMDAQYQNGVHQLERARADLANALVDAVHYAATGERRATTQVEPPADRTTSGALYCRLITKLLGGVATAEAAEVPSRSAPRDTGASSASTTKTPQRKNLPGKNAHGKSGQAQRESTLSKAAQAKLAAQRDSLRRALMERLAQGKNQPVIEPPPAGVVARAAANAAAITLSPQATANQIDIIRARITGARSTMSRYEVEIQKKFALAAACIVFVLFGAPIALRFPRGGVGLVIGVSMIAFSLYYVCLIAGEALAHRLILSPFWAMWAANAIFTVSGIFLLVRVQHSGATARGGDAGEMWEAVRGWFARQARRVGIRAERRQRIA